MSENPPENSASSVPPAARQAFEEWVRTGEDAALNRLIAELFVILGIPDFERVYGEEGDAAV
ncbi:MAG TPA: hypothetical protein PKI32_08955, partial [Opitutales bacterium]|nr:hypothetical protein [Opitutales bacterium]